MQEGGRRRIRSGKRGEKKKKKKIEDEILAQTGHRFHC